VIVHLSVATRTSILHVTGSDYSVRAVPREVCCNRTRQAHRYAEGNP